MPSTLTLRRSVAVGLLLLVVGGGLYGYGAHEATTTESPSGLAVEHRVVAAGPVTNVSELNRSHRGLFLLAVGEGGVYLSTDERIQSLARTIPERIRYEGEVYSAWRTHVDGLGGGTYSRPAGLLLVAAGLLSLAGAGFRSILRRARG